MHPFINGDSTISGKHCSMLVSLPNDVVEQILVRLAVKSLMRFKAVSKQWKSTIESRFFRERQLMQCKQPVERYVLMVSVFEPPGPLLITLRTLVVGSSSPSSSFRNITPWENNKTQTCYLASHSSCDGLVCLYSLTTSGFVLNPITKWYRTLPLSHYQQTYHNLGRFFRIGFGKDKIRGTYKPVWLYNSEIEGRENGTKCEVFDFSTNAWRYITPAAPYCVLDNSGPVYVDGCLYWFTTCIETKLLSLDLHTENFQVIHKAPFGNSGRFGIIMCTLGNRLCVFETQFYSHVIWSFDSVNKTWDKVYFIDKRETISLYMNLPVANFDGEKRNKKKLLFCRQTLVIHDLDPETKSHEIAFSAKHIKNVVSYIPSLISIE